MANPVSYQGRGSSLALGTDGIAYTAIAQLEKFGHAGADSTLEKVTCLDSPGNNEFYLPTIVDNKEISFEGVLDPQNATIQNAYNYLENQTLLYFKATLKNGSSFTGQCYVTKFKIFDADVRKAVMFSGAITVFGGITWTP